MHAGSLTHTITVERRTIRLNDSREEVVAWVPVLTTQAELVSLTMDEKATTAESLVAIFRLRYIDGIEPADQIELNGEFFDIKSVAEIGRREGLEIRAVAKP